MSSTDAKAPNLHRSWILALVCLGQFMVLLDISIVNVALPSIRNSLHFDPVGLQWIVNAYTLTFAGFLLLGGRAADLFGQRKLFLLGIVVFGGASIAGGLANDRSLLIAARALQGFGGAVLSPATLTILTTTFTDPKERSRAMGIWGSVAGAGGAAGALLGGILTDLVNWRAIFILNVPIAVIAFIGGARLLKLRNESHSKALDALGAMLVTLGLVAVVYGIVSSEQYGWGSVRVLGSFIGGLALLVWFALHEAHVAKEPIMPLSLWKIPSLTAANLVMLLMSMGMFAMWFFLSLDLQSVRHFSPLKAGFTFLPQTLAIIIGAQVSSRLLQKVGARLLSILAMSMGAFGMLWLSLALDHNNLWINELIPGSITTLGLGLGMTPIVSSAMAGVDRKIAGLASGLINTSRQVGGSIGLAILITLANSRSNHLLHTDTVNNALVSGYRLGLGVGTTFMVAATLLAFLLPAQKRTRMQPSEAVNSSALALD